MSEGLGVDGKGAQVGHRTGTLRDGDLLQQQHPARDGAWGEPAVGVQCWDQPQQGANHPGRRVSGA